MRNYGRAGNIICRFAWLLLLIMLPGNHATQAMAQATPTSQPTLAAPDPLEAYKAAMRPAFVGDVAANANRPRYDLRLWINPSRGVITGTEQIVFPNNTGAALNDVALRLYPNFPRNVFGYGGNVRMNVTEAAVAGQPVAVNYGAQNTTVLLPFVQPLAPGQSTTLAVSFNATIKPAEDGTWQLPSYYPMLAVRDGIHWRLDVTRFADIVFAESALYRAQITIPANLALVTTGSTTDVQPQPNGTATHTVVSGPVREFALSVGDLAAAHATAGDVAVNVYTRRGSTLDAPQVARVAAAALGDFEQRFGPYPYRELDIHLFRDRFDGGSEYPGLILLSSNGQIDAGTRYVTAHEVAHQWWYGVVGNDIYRQPWLDEAFAQYSGIIYAEDVAGQATAQADWQREIVGRYNGAVADGDRPVGLTVYDYPNFNVYYRTIYGKGPVFLRTLRQQIGDKAFFAGLKLYYQRQRYNVATTADVRRAFEEASGRDLAELFKGWIGG